MKACMHTLLLAGSLLLTANVLLAQKSDELLLLASHFEPVGHKNTAEGTNDQRTGSIIGTAFYVYKTFISSQDHMSCVFAPSCSEYAVQAIHAQGVVVGLMNTFDRLIRCNGLRPQDYGIDPRLQRLVDPVRDIHYEKP